MTLAIVQTILAGLGITTGLLIALLGPGTRWIRWPLALAAGTGVAVTGLPTLWQDGNSPIQQLWQSLLLGAVVVLIALLTMMLLHPSKRAKQRAKKQQLSAQSATLPAPQTVTANGVLDELATPEEAGRDAIDINLEQNPKAMIANQDEHAHMHLLGSTKSAPKSDNVSVLTEDNEPLLIEIASDVALVDLATIGKRNLTGTTADVVSLDERREKQLTAALDDELGLADSDELYQAMRDAEAELDLSDDSTWLNDDTDFEIETHSNIDDLLRDSSASSVATGITTGIPTDGPIDIEDAEILEIVDDIEATGDTTITDLPIPSKLEFESELDLELEPSGIERPSETPATLKDALSAQRQSISQLSTDTDVLAERLSEWRSLSDDNEKAAWTSSLLQGQTVQQQHQRILAENNFRQAAVELIQTQRDVMKQLMNQIGILGTQREEDLETLTGLQQNAVTQRRLTSQAALLARKAAADKRELSDGLSEERVSHERTRGAARRAMGIARDAVDKLAEHEKKLGLISESVNSDANE